MQNKQKIINQKIEEIYDTFAKYSPEPNIRFCDCCYSKDEHQNLKRILSSPAKIFTAHDLSEYESALAIGGWSQTKTIKYILPLYMESILSIESDIYPDTFFYFIEHIKDKEWRDNEKELIESSLLSLLDYYLDTHPDMVYEKVSRIDFNRLLTMFEYLNSNKALDLWLKHTNYTSILYLKEFLYGYYSQRNKPIEKWLENPKNRKVFTDKIEKLIVFETQEVSEKDLVELNILYEFL